MGLWVSPIQEGRAGFRALQWAGAPIHADTIRSWRNRWDGTNVLHGHQAGFPITRIDLKTVPPAFFVEFRALEIRKDEIEAAVRRPELVALIGRALRPWPFRWPIPEEETPAVEMPPLASPRPGQFVNILT